jgi:transposase-like protein
MAEISYRRHRFPPVIIQHAVWLYLRFTLSYRDVEELLAERGGMRSRLRDRAFRLMLLLLDRS